MTMKDRLPLVADLLMEAAHADERLDGEEKDAVKRLLCGILEVPSLPMDLAFRIDEFDAKGFDHAPVAKAFAADPPELKKRLLELIAAVHAADGDLHVAARSLDVPDRTVMQWAAARSGVRPLQPADQLQQRRLPGSGRADDGDDLAGRGVQRDVAQRDDVTEPAGHALQPNFTIDVTRPLLRSLEPGLHRSLRGHYPTGSKGQRRVS